MKRRALDVKCDIMRNRITPGCCIMNERLKGQLMGNLGATHGAGWGKGVAEGKEEKH